MLWLSLPTNPDFSCSSEELGQGDRVLTMFLGHPQVLWARLGEGQPTLLLGAASMPWS